MSVTHRTTTCLAVGLAILFYAEGARAHSIVVHSGTVQWSDSVLCIQLDADEHVLAHEIKALRETLSETQMLARLAHSIMVVGHESGPISIDRIESMTNPPGVTCYFNVPPSVSAVALTHQPDRRELGPLARQIQLGLKDKDGTIARHLRLTSRGNHAVVLRRQTVNGPTGVDPFVEPVLKVCQRADGRSLQVDYPCRLLATWSEMRAFDKPSISLAEFDTLRPAINNWIDSNLSVSMRQTDALIHLQSNARRLTWIDPKGHEINADYSKHITIVTSRIRFEIDLPGAETNHETTIDWRGFNAAVNRLIVLKKAGRTTELRGLLTPLEATMIIRGTAPALVEFRRTADE